MIFKIPISENQKQTQMQNSENTAALNSLKNDLKNEANTRSNADNVINLELTNLRNVLNAEINARTSETSILNADLQTEINQRENLTTSLNADLNQHKLDNDAAFTAVRDEINSKLDTEKLLRSQEIADTRAAILAALGDSQAAESIENENLREQIENATREQATALNNLSGSLEIETAKRIEGDTELKNALDSEIQNRQDAVNSEIQARNTAIDNASASTKNYIDSQIAAVEGNLNEFTAPTATAPGKRGLVPAPPASSETQILTAAGWRTPSNATLTISSLPVQVGNLTYNRANQAPVWLNFDSKKLKITGEISGTDAKTYNVTFTPLDVFIWEDTLDQTPKNQTWKIDPLLLVKPSAAVTEFDCDETLKTLQVSNFDAVYQNQTGTIAESDPGNYQVTYSLKNKNNTKWTDLTTADVVINWKINLIVLTLAQSSNFAQAGTLTYNGNSQNVTVSNFDAKYHVLGSETSKVNAGTYTATITPRAGCVWYDNTKVSKIVSWTIQPKKITKPNATITSYEYDGTIKNLQVQNYDSNYILQSGVVSTAESGEYTATYSLRDKNNLVWQDNTTADFSIIWNVGAKELPKPTCNTKNFTYDGNDKNISVQNYDSNYMSQVGTLSAKNAGEYKVTYHLLNTGRAKWSDGSVDDIVIEWKIDRKKLSASQSTLSISGSYTFNGNNQSVSINNYDPSIHEISGDVSKLEAGTYEIQITPKSNYAWNNGNFDSKKLNWTISVLKLQKPSANVKTFTWTGSQIALNVSNYDSNYEKQTGTISATNIGDYQVTYSLKNKNSSTWQDNSTADVVIDWQIERQRLTASQSSFAQSGILIYSGARQAPEISNFDTSFHVASGDINGVNAGTYTMKISPKYGYCWSNGTYGEQNVNWTIQPMTVNVPVADETDFKFDGNNHKPNITGYNATYMTQAGDTGNKSAVGNYQITYTLKNANTIWSTGNANPYVINWSIGLTKLTIPSVRQDSFVYDGNYHEISLQNFDSENMEIDEDFNQTGATNVDHNNPDFWVEVRIKLKDTTRYCWSDNSTTSKSIWWRIIPKNLTAAQSSFSQAGTLTFNGNSQTVTLTNFNATIHKLGGNYISTNAGTFVAQVLPGDNYAWNDGTRDTKYVQWKIDPLKLTKPTLKNAEIVYDKNIHEVEILNYNDDFMSLTGTRSAANVGTYQLICSLKGKPNVLWADDSTSNIYLIWNIYKVSFEIPEISGDSEFTYNGNTKTLQIANVNLNGMAATSDSTLSAVNAGSYFVTYALKDKELTQWSDGSVDDIKLDWTIRRQFLNTELSNPFQQTIPQYTGNAFSVTSSIIKGQNTNYQIWSGDTSASAVGNYTAYVIPKSNYCWSDGTIAQKAVKWQIARAEIAKVAVDTATTLRYTGNVQSPVLLNFDTNKVTLAGDLNGTNAGEYSLTATPNANYCWEEDNSQDALTLTWNIEKMVVELPHINYTGANLISNELYSSGENCNVRFDGQTTSYIIGDYLTFDSDNSKISSAYERRAQTPLDFPSYTSTTLSTSESDCKSVGIYFRVNDTENKTFKWNYYKSEKYPNQEKTRDYLYCYLYLYSVVIDIIAPEYKNVVYKYDGTTKTFLAESERTSDYYTAKGTFESKGAKNANYSYTCTLTRKQGYYFRLVDLNGNPTGKYATAVQYEWGVSDGVVKIPTLAQNYFDYDKNEHSVTINNFDAENMDSTGTLTATDRDYYSVTVSLKDKTNKRWANGKTGDITLGWAIGKKKIAKPTLIITDEEATTLEFEYDGTEKTATISGYDSNTMNLTGNITATDAGSYSAKFTPKNTTACIYYWADDGTTSTVTLNWKINRQPLPEVTFTAPTRYYVGKERPAVFKGFDANYHVISGGTTSATNAGTYSAKISPKPNYCWADGTTSAVEANWSLQRLNLPVLTASEVNFDYTGNEITLPTPSQITKPMSLNDGNGKYPADITFDCDDILTITGNKATMPGEYTATFTINEPNNLYWSGSPNDPVYTINWKIEPMVIEVPKISLFMYVKLPKTTYSPKINNLNKEAVTVSSDTYTLNPNDFDTNLHEVNNKIYFTRGDAYTWANGDTSTTISKSWILFRDFTKVEEQDLTLTYNGTGYNFFEAFSAFKKNEYLQTVSTAEKLTYIKEISGTAYATDAGTYTVTLTPSPIFGWGAGNDPLRTTAWTAAPRDFTWTIDKADPTINLTVNPVPSDSPLFVVSVYIDVDGDFDGEISVTTERTIDTVYYNPSTKQILLVAEKQGTAYVTVNVTEGKNYNAGSKTIDFTYQPQQATAQKAALKNNADIQAAILDLQNAILDIYSEMEETQ